MIVYALIRSSISMILLFCDKPCDLGEDLIRPSKKTLKTRIGSFMEVLSQSLVILFSESSLENLSSSSTSWLTVGTLSGLKASTLSALKGTQTLPLKKS